MIFEEAIIIPPAIKADRYSLFKYSFNIIFWTSFYIFPVHCAPIIIYSILKVYHIFIAEMTKIQRGIVLSNNITPGITLAKGNNCANIVICHKAKLFNKII